MQVELIKTEPPKESMTKVKLRKEEREFLIMEYSHKTASQLHEDSKQRAIKIIDANTNTGNDRCLTDEILNIIKSVQKYKKTTNQ